MYVCMFSTADLEIRNVPFPKKVSSNSDLPQAYLWFPFGSYWLLPKNIISFCPGCSKSFASVGLVKNLLSFSSTHSKGLSVFPIQVRSELSLNLNQLETLVGLILCVRHFRDWPQAIHELCSLCVLMLHIQTISEQRLSNKCIEISLQKDAIE